MVDRNFGEVAGFPVGSEFEDRAELSASGVHKPLQAGISGGQDEGADSIVVSGGYQDDEDYGDWILYTGHGGNDPGTKRQIADQVFTRGNRALAISCDRLLPVRLVRGASGDPSHSPETGFRYDGLYFVESYWPTTGHDGFRIYRYRLHTIGATEQHIATVRQQPTGSADPARSPVTTERLVRDPRVSEFVKALYDHRCQICQTRLVVPSGPYAEGAHIRPLGRPHDGPDTPANVLCLCPNCHVLLDRAALYVDSDLKVWDSSTAKQVGSLEVNAAHELDVDHILYHQSLRIADVDPR